MRKLINGVLLSFAALSITIISSLIVYRTLWTNNNPSGFASWIAFFELAQFFLLADIGFTHKYIRDRSAKKNEQEYLIEKLRGGLLLVGGASSLTLLAIAELLGQRESVGLIPILAISASTCITLFSYADAAELRAQEKFNVVYPIQIISQIAFVVFILISNNIDPIILISIATLLRSALQSLLQILSLRGSYRIKLTWQGAMDTSVFAFNGGYFILFLLDGIIMVWAGIPSYTTASVLLTRKYYDLVRGFSDSALQVFSNKFSKEKTSIQQMAAIILITLLMYALAFLFATSGAIDAWIGKPLNIPTSMLIILSINGFSISIYRWISSIIYFNRRPGTLLFLIISLISKFIFLSIISGSKSIELGYEIQAAAILLMITWFLLNQKGVFGGKTS